MSYTYDSLHRLTAATTNGSTGYPQWGLSWSYDRYGNRTAQSVTSGSGPSNSVSVSTSTNQISSMGSSNFYYDANGNLTQDDLNKYKYDGENRMVEIDQLNGTTIATYGYDGNSIRNVKVWGAGRTIDIYAGSQLISEFEDAASNTYSSGTTPAQAASDSGAIVLYQHRDHLTTRVTTDSSASSMTQQAHYPFGESWYDTGAVAPSVERKFTTYMKDAESGSGQLNYAVHRQHSPRIGRFNSPDALTGHIGAPQSLNRYAYSRNNAINLVDPLGRSYCSFMETHATPSSPSRVESAGGGPNARMTEQEDDDDIWTHPDACITAGGVWVVDGAGAGVCTGEFCDFQNEPGGPGFGQLGGAFAAQDQYFSDLNSIAQWANSINPMTGTSALPPGINQPPPLQSILPNSGGGSSAIAGVGVVWSTFLGGTIGTGYSGLSGPFPDPGLRNTVVNDVGQPFPALVSVPTTKSTCNLQMQDGNTCFYHCTARNSVVSTSFSTTLKALANGCTLPTVATQCPSLIETSSNSSTTKITGCSQ